MSATEVTGGPAGLLGIFQLGLSMVKISPKSYDQSASVVVGIVSMTSNLSTESFNYPTEEALPCL